MIRESYFIQGVVQGVGFRPFVYKIATAHNLKGFVKNNERGVAIEVEGDLASLILFEEELINKIPPLARIDNIKKKQLEVLNTPSFEIIKSSLHLKSAKGALVSPDIAICDECLEDIQNIEKYKNYFATNCTNCGPRYSIIETVPYDREKTSMKKFEMCRSCEGEYRDPLKRRYHAQPISCNSCGPTLSVSIENIAELIKAGKIVAIKGIGGFHIVCDATNDDVIQRLRLHKNRPSKPFAIMCKNIMQVETFATLKTEELELLSSKEAPIVILDKTDSIDVNLSAFVAPNIKKIGCFLPYTALHHILFRYLDNPIVATSANLGNEPIITNKERVLQKLPFVDFVLDFDRDIVNGVDDSLVQVIAGKRQTLRLSRGYAPKVIKLPFKSKKKILAVGANAKNAIAFVMDDNIIISPHIGDLDSLEAFEFFERTLKTFKRFYDFEPDIIVHDKHPNYETTKWAKTQDKELVEVQHHLAHIYACKAEFGLSGDYLGFSFDGTGYGDDGTLWGGEMFVGDKRKYTFKSIKLLGAQKAIKEPRRVALAMLFNELCLGEVLQLKLDTIMAFSEHEIKTLHQSYTKNLNAPSTSSVGRLFDAVASLSGVVQKISYEGESGLLCEAYYDEKITKCFEYTLVDGVIDIEIIPYILKSAIDKYELNSMLINTLVNIVVDISREEKGEVILSGGVFQNKTLLELVMKRLKEEAIKYYAQETTAINDGGIALGQAYYSLLCQ